MKKVVQLFFFLFFLVSVGVHIYFLYAETDKKILYHAAYLITYGCCWWAFFTQHGKRLQIYFLMMLFPLLAHLFYAGKHIAESNYDAMFWVCIAVSVILPAGYIYLRKTVNLRSEDV
jgi:hypothetical protein